jgi:hypothetical protein
LSVEKSSARNTKASEVSQRQNRKFLPISFTAEHSDISADGAIS